MRTFALSCLVAITGCSKTEDPIQAAAEARGFAIAICAPDTESTIEEVSMLVCKHLGGVGYDDYTRIELRSTGVEHCAVLDREINHGISTFTAEQIGVTQPTIRELHVYYMPLHVEPQARHAPFMSVLPIKVPPMENGNARPDTFAFRVIATDAELPTATIGQMQPGGPFLVPIDGAY